VSCRHRRGTEQALDPTGVHEAEEPCGGVGVRGPVHQDVEDDVRVEDRFHWYFSSR
jgi:hypothetical protein